MKKMLLLGAAFATLALSLPAQAELKFKPGEDKRFNWQNYEDLKKVDLKGETLTIFGPWRGEDEGLIRTVLEYFQEATGAEIKYSSSENYEQQIVIDTQAGSPPNIAVLPQPGLIQDLASKGLLTPLGDDLLLEISQLFLRLRHRIAGFLEIVRRVPDQRFHVGLVGEGKETGLAVLVLEGAEIDP